MGIDSFQFIQQQLENVTGKSSGNSHHNESDRKAEVPQFPMPSPANKVLPSTPSEVAKSETHNYSEHHGEKPQEIKKTGLVLQSTKPLGLEKMTLSSPMQTSPISPQGATGISFRSSSTVHAPVGSQHHHHQGASAVKIVTKGRNKWRLRADNVSMPLLSVLWKDLVWVVLVPVFLLISSKKGGSQLLRMCTFMLFWRFIYCSHEKCYLFENDLLE